MYIRVFFKNFRNFFLKVLYGINTKTWFIFDMFPIKKLAEPRRPLARVAAPRGGRWHAPHLLLGRVRAPALCRRQPSRGRTITHARASRGTFTWAAACRSLCGRARAAGLPGECTVREGWRDTLGSARARAPVY
jgi:hypothetical protein